MVQLGRWDVPFAAILDVVTTVAFVPTMHSMETTARDLREIVWYHARNAGLRVRMSNRILEDLDGWRRKPEAASWYEMLRGRWRPDVARIVVIADSVPDPRGPRHHFYAEPMTKGDDLFRAVIEAFYGHKPGRVGESKEQWLQRLRHDGIFVIDLVTTPLILPDELEEERNRRVPLCVRETFDLHPDGVVLCGESTFVLTHSGLPVIQSIPVPFPAGRGRKPFLAAMREILAAFGWQASMPVADEM